MRLLKVFLFCFLFFLSFFNIVKAETNVYDTSYQKCGTQQQIMSTGGESAFLHIYSFYATTSSYLYRADFNMNCAYSNGCDYICRWYEGVASTTFASFGSVYANWTTNTTISEYGTVEAPSSIANATTTWVSIIDADGLSNGFATEAGHWYFMSCAHTRNAIGTTYSSQPGTCYFPSSDKHYVSMGALDGTFSPNVTYYPGYPHHAKLYFNTDYEEPSIYINDLSFEYPEQNSLITDFDSFVLSYGMNQAMVDYIIDKNAVAYLSVFLEANDNRDFSLTLDSEPIPLNTDPADWYLPKSGMLPAGKYKASGMTNIQYDCEENFTNCTYEYLAETAEVQFEIIPGADDPTLLKWRSDIGSVNNLTCFVGEDCRLWFSFNDMAIGLDVELYEQSCDLSANNCSTNLNGTSTASTEIVFSSNHQNYIDIPAEQSEKITKYDLLLIDPTYGNSVFSGIKVKWTSEEAFKDFLDDTRLGLDARASAIAHACDDVASSTGTFDDFRFGIECGFRKFVAWAFTPSEEVLLQNKRYINSLQNGFPLNVINSTQMAFSSFGAASSSGVYLNLGGLNEDFSGMTLLSGELIEEVSWYGLYVYPVLKYIVWISLFAFTFFLLIGRMTPRNYDN